jgi:cytoskeletal protein RodZ
MKTVGETLQSVREKQDKTLDQISSSTSIKKEFLVAIEAGEFSSLPSPVAVQGFISTYAEVLGIEPKTALALLRRDYSVTRSGILPKHLMESNVKRTRQRGNKTYMLTIAGACFLTVVGFVFWSYLQLHKPPSLVITAPKDGALIGADVTVRGVTASDATVEVDAQTVSLTQDGEFAQNETLSQGDHTITVIARNRAKQETIKQVFVHVQE